MKLGRPLAGVGLTIAIACGGPVEFDANSGSGGAASSGAATSSGGKPGKGSGGRSSNEGGMGGDETSGGSESGTGASSSSSGGSDSRLTGGSSSSGGRHAGADGGSGTGGGGQGTMTVEEFCDARFATFCNHRLDCDRSCDPTGLSGGGYAPHKWECLDAITSLKAGFLDYHPEAVAGCLKAIDQEPCTGSGSGSDQLLRACAKVFSGKLPLDSECQSADSLLVFDECEGSVCERARDSATGRFDCLGKCVAAKAEGEACASSAVCQEDLRCWQDKCLRRGGVGEDCTNVICQDGLICDGTPTFTCRKPEPIGSACTDYFDCRDSLCVAGQCAVDAPNGTACSSSSWCASEYCANGACEATLMPGAACDAGGQCSAGYDCPTEAPRVCVKAKGTVNGTCGPSGCEDGLWCNWDTTTCTAQVGEGGDCTASDSACTFDLHCMADKKCHSPGKQDGPCLPNGYQSCEVGFFCDQVTALCDTPRALGEQCNSLTQSESCMDGLYCYCVGADCPRPQSPHAEDKCVSQLTDNLSCNGNFECLGGYCTDGKCSSQPPTTLNLCSR